MPSTYCRVESTHLTKKSFWMLTLKTASYMCVLYLASLRISHVSTCLIPKYPIVSEQGYVVLTILPYLAELKQIRLNSRQITIHNVLVNELPGKYTYDDPLTPVVPPSTLKTAHHHNEYRQQYIYALQEADEGELLIDIPEPILKQQAPQFTPSIKSHDGNSTGEANRSSLISLSPIVIRIDFSLRNPNGGIHFVIPEDVKTLERFPQLYTHNQALSTRMWIPCIDRYQEACTWDISIIIPATLRHTFPHYYEEGVPDEDDEETGEIIGDRSMIVVCSGEPEEEVMHPKQPTKKICRFSLRRPIGASSIMFAVGPFEVIPIPGWFKKSRVQIQDGREESPEENSTDTAEADGEEDSASEGAFAFCLPGREDHVDYTVSFMSQALHYFEQYLGVPFPYLSYKQIFLEDTYNPVATGATISLFSSHLLLHEHIIDQTYESMRLLCRALVSQWFGHFLVPKSWADTWLLVGLTNYVVALFLQRFFGKNEYKFRLRKDMQRVCELDVNQPPLSPIPIPMDDTQSGDHHATVDPLILQHFHPDDDWSSVRSEFVGLKSYVVLHMLDRKLGKGVLRKVITTTLTAASNGELPNGLSTHNFFRLARKLTGKGELKSFADQWVYGSGCPRFSFKYNFNRKKMAVEFRFHQENVNGGIIGSTARFSGPFMIRIHEPGGTYDTEVHLEEQDKQYDIQYHTKYKRIRRKAVTGPRGKKGTGEEQEAVQNEPVEADDMRGENADSKGDWHDEEPDRLDFEWIRLDPDNDWLCVKDFEQTEFMWASQLKKDKDVYAQLDAIAGLSRLPSTGTCTVLSEFINRKMSYYGLRMQAAAVLARCLSDLAVKGSEGALVQQYIDDYCFVPKEGSCEIYARSHDFTELEEYYVQKSIVSALGTIRLDDDYAPKSCQRLLLNLLKFNDNTNNQYSDNYFMANLILALGDAFLPQSSLKPRRPPIVAPRISATSGDVEEFFFGGDSDDEDFTVSRAVTDIHEAAYFKEALEEIDRRCLLDRFIPSYHNTVTIATLRVKLKWMLAGLIPVDVGLFLQHARQGHFLGVRLMGIDGLFLLKGLAYSQVARFLLAVVADDPVPYVRYHAAKALAEYVEVLVAEGKAVTPENGAGDPLSNGAGANINEFDILRWQIAAQPDTARIVWELMNSAKTLEHRIRVNLLRFCEYLYDPAPEDKTHGVNGGAHTKLKIKMAIKRPHDESGSEDEMALLPPKKVTLKDGNKRRKLDDHKIKLKPQPPPEPLLPPDAGFLAICEKCLDRLICHGSSALFVFPVDALRNAEYYRIIKKPMDLQSARRNASTGVYANDINRFLADIRLIFRNCYEYNVDDSNPYRQAKKLETFFEESVVPDVMKAVQELADKKATAMAEAAAAEMAVAEQAQRVASQAVQEEKAAPLSALPSPPPAGELYPAQEPVRELVVPSVPALSIAPAEQLQGTKGGMTAQEFDMCLKLWKVVHGNPVAYWFYAPVDPVALNIPNYPQVIKNPMDLSTIKSKLDQRIYNAPSEFKADVRLMLNNSLQFNPPGTLVHNDSKILLHDFSKAWNERAKYLRDHSTSNAANKVSKIPTGDDKVGTPPPSAGLSSADYAQCSQVLRKLSNAGPIAEPFLEPVSKVLYPYYHEVIKSPMDLHTIRKRLEGKRYKTLRDFEADVRLMLSNCFTFNRPGDPVYTQGKTLETIFEQSWTKPKGTAISKKSSNAGSLPASPAPHTPPAVPSPIGPPPPVTVPEEKAELQPGDRKALQRLLQKLQAHPAAAVFLQPVDPVALNIPHYTQVIKNPMDLGTIQKKLDSGSYVTPAQLAADVELMLSNCFTFNLPEDWVYGQGKILEAEFKKAWKKLLVQQGTSQTAAKAAVRQTTPASVARGPSPAPSRPASVLPPQRPLSVTDEAKIRKALDAVSAFESAGIFTVPVDPLVLPDYHLKVKNPIDLQTMRGKLDANEYLLLNEFEADMKLLFDNCYTYNEKSSYGHNCGVATEKYFKRLWKSIKGASDSTEKDKKRMDNTRESSNGLWSGNAATSATDQVHLQQHQSNSKRKRKGGEDDGQRKKVKVEGGAREENVPPNSGAPRPSVKLKISVKK